MQPVLQVVDARLYSFYIIFSIVMNTAVKLEVTWISVLNTAIRFHCV